MSNSQTLAKNTIVLYIRMVLIMAIQLYTVRIVLRTLGETDYGVYSLVSGVVSMFSFLSSTMAISSQRYFSIEISNNNLAKLGKVFSLTIIIYLLVSLIILVLLETLGLWFLNNKLNIPSDRINATNWLYQFTILSFILTILKTPYDALIIAKEKMNIFAYLSFLEVFLKLLVVYFLNILLFDKLVLYGFLSFLVAFIITFFYKIYCNKMFLESRFKYYWESSLFKNMLSYSSWNLIGSLSGILYNQGVNILLNIFFGPIINAARGIAFQINSVVNQFAFNFMTAVRPQITKLYVKDEIDKMFNLMFKSTKFSFFLVFLISTPLIYAPDYVFGLWLGEVPEYLSLFTRLIIIVSLIDSLSYSIMSTVQAIGRIKVYQIVVGLFFMINLPISFLVLKAGYPPEYVFYIAIIIAFLCFFLRVIILKYLITFDLPLFISSVLIPVISVVFFSCLLNYFLFSFFLKANTIYGIFISGIVVFFSVFLIGMTKMDRSFIYNIIIKKFKNV